MKTKTNYNTYFFYAIVAGLTILTFFILKPFLIPFLLAAILVHFFSPVYKYLLKKTRREWLSSMLTCLLIALIIIIPVLAILGLVVGEVQSAISRLAANPESVNKMIGLVRELAARPVFKSLDLGKIASPDYIISSLKNFAQILLVVLQGTYASLLHFLFVMLIMFFSLYYLFIDGKKLVGKILKIIPLERKYENIMLDKLNSMVRATIKGAILMAILHGIVGGLLFWATGVASPIIFGILMAIFSVIPPVGSSVVWIPVGITMIILGHPAEGTLILLAGLFIISTMDNLIRPRLVGRDTQMHPLLILFSTLGGIALFGLSGFIVGPIVVSLLVVLWNIYILEFKA